ncbi:MAG: coniferyl-alcohol dehydrogenase [Acidimicrobiia bacterium]
MPLEGKTIVTTGAASGIGKETAAELKRQGAFVIAVDRQAVEDADDWRETDLADPASIRRLVDGLPTGIDGIANIAGLPPSAPAADVIKVNLRGLQMFTQATIPKLADHASIVNIASSAGNGWPDSVDQIKEFESVGWDEIESFTERHHMDEGGRSYFFSKEALIVWTMQNRWTWIDRGIRMNAVSPGPIDTPILGDFIDTLGPRAQSSINATERVGRPDDIAPVVAFLMSDAAKWFRGANLTPDGGLTSQLLLQRHGLD